MSNQRLNTQQIARTKEIFLAVLIKRGFNYKKAVFITTRLEYNLRTLSSYSETVRHYEEMVASPFSHRRINVFLRESFSWDASDEGNDFWNEVDDVICEELHASDVAPPDAGGTTLWGS